MTTAAHSSLLPSTCYSIPRLWWEEVRPHLAQMVHSLRDSILSAFRLVPDGIGCHTYKPTFGSVPLVLNTRVSIQITLHTIRNLPYRKTDFYTPSFKLGSKLDHLAGGKREGSLVQGCICAIEPCNEVYDSSDRKRSQIIRVRR